MKKVDKLVMQGTEEDMNQSFEEYLRKSIPDKDELAYFKSETESLLLLHGAFVQGWRLGLKMMIASLENYDVYEKDLSSK